MDQRAINLFSVASKANAHRSIVVHSIAFRTAANQAFLERVCDCGTSPGTFRFAADSKEVDAKFLDVFELASSSLNAKFVPTPSVPNSPVYDCMLVANEGAPIFSGSLNLPPKAEVADDAVVEVKGVRRLLRLTQVAKPNSLMRIRMLENMAITSEADVKRIMSLLSCTVHKGVSMSERLESDLIRKELNDRLLTYLQTFNSIQQNAVSASTNLKLADMRYEARFQQARRQRTMALRMNDNMKKMREMDQKLDDMRARLTDAEIAELDKLGDKWNCTLSLQNVCDVLRDTRDDFLCLGVYVERTVTSVDSPTVGVKLKFVSSTVISYVSFMDAMSRAIVEKGDSAAHGGLREEKRLERRELHEGAPVGQEEPKPDEMAYCVVGQAREKINAVLPLYLHPLHFERVKLLKPFWCGYFFTLDSLGYEKNQEVALSTMLASMILLCPTASEFNQSIIDEFAKVAGHCVHHSSAFKLAFPPNKLEEFITRPEARRKGDHANLLTVLGIGYVLDRVNPDLTIVQEPTFSTVKRLVLPVHWETVKRRIMNEYAGSKIKAHEMARLLLFGDPKSMALQLRRERSSGHDASAPAAAAAAEGEEGEVKRPGPPRNPGVMPDEVARLKLEQQFEQYFYDPEHHVPPKIVLDGKVRENDALLLLGAVANKGVIMASLETYKPLMFINRFLENARAGENPLVVIGTDDYMEEARGNLLLCFYYYNDYPPVHVDAQSIVQVAMDDFVNMNEQKARNQSLAEEQQRLCDYICETLSVPAFAGMLRVYCPTRSNALFDLVVRQLVRTGHADMIEAIMTNQVQEAFDLYDGKLKDAIWVPNGIEQCRQIRLLLGAEKFKSIEKSNVDRAVETSAHMYRLSDLPNRHGYCNSNPWKGWKIKFSGYDRLF